MWVEYDVEAGGASAGSLKMMHKTKTRRRRKKRDRVLVPFPSLSSDMELYFYKLHARVQAIPFKSYYSQYKAYVPDQDRMLRLLQYIIYFVAVMLPSSSPRVNAFPSSSSSLPSPLWHMHDRVSFGRYLFRFYYLADAVPATKSGSWGVNKTLGQVMAACMVGYYPFEHFAFWLWYQPQLFPTNVVDWADFLWSIASMFWFVYLLAELCNYTILLQGHLKERATKRNNNDYHLIRKVSRLSRSMEESVSYHPSRSIHASLPLAAN